MRRIKKGKVYMRRRWEKLPKEFVRRLRKITPEVYLGDVLNSFSTRRPTTLRANTLKIKGYQLCKELDRNGVKVESVAWYKEAFIVKNKSLRELIKLKLYKEGYFYVQSLSSMVPPLVLNPKPEEKILDICAAPGSKTTQMAMMMENKGEIVANDISTIRLEKLKANLRIQGVENVKLTKMPAQGLWNSYREYFDKTLVDVPCSMEGRMNCFDKESYQWWSLKKVKNLSKMQRWILRSAVTATKPGGKIVYSTCTLSLKENEEVIAWILDKEKGKLVIERINISNLKIQKGLTEFEGKIFSKEVAKTIRILPSSDMEGFYLASIRKTKSTLGNLKV